MRLCQSHYLIITLDFFKFLGKNWLLTDDHYIIIQMEFDLLSKKSLLNRTLKRSYRNNGNVFKQNQRTA